MAQTAEALILTCNRQAMDLLRAQEQQQALALLLRAEAQVQTLPPSQTQAKLRSITLNNLGCFYKRAAQPLQALEYLQAALDLAADSDRTNLAGTHLNICAIKSQLGNHHQALQHALEALRLLNACLQAPSPNQVTTLVIAHHNAGVELEYLRQGEQAAEAYRQGLDLANHHLGIAHPLAASLQRSYLTALDRRDLPTSPRRKKQKRVISVTPAPHKLMISPGPQMLPRRAVSKGAYDRSKPISSPLYELEEGEADLRWTGRDNHISNIRKNAPGLHLQPLNYHTPTSKNSRRDKSHSAPESTHKPRSPAHRKAPESARVYRFRRDGEGGELGTKAKRKVKTLEVVNILSQTIGKGGEEATLIVGGLKIYFARRLAAHLAVEKRSEGRKTAELRARAAIDALEMLKKQAFEEFHPVSRPALPTAPRKSSLHSKSRKLAVIPETAESHSDMRRLQLARVQAWCRTALVRQDWLRRKQAAVVLQKWVRMHQTRQLFLSILSAVLFIQTWWRAHRL